MPTQNTNSQFRYTEDGIIDINPPASVIKENKRIERWNEIKELAAITAGFAGIYVLSLAAWDVAGQTDALFEKRDSLNVATEIMMEKYTTTTGEIVMDSMTSQKFSELKNMTTETQYKLEHIIPFEEQFSDIKKTANKLYKMVQD